MRIGANSEKGLRILKYEEDMFTATYNALPKNEFGNSTGNTVERPNLMRFCWPLDMNIHDAILESFLIHVRIFIEFLYVKRNHYTRDTDILAEDYFDVPTKWHELIKDIPEEFKNIKDNLDKMLAHMSLSRFELQVTWNCPKLYQWITNGLKLFHENKGSTE